jgi:hypothetical protein
LTISLKKDVPRDAISKFFTVESARDYDRDKELGPYTIEKVPPLPKDKEGRYGFEPFDPDCDFFLGDK